MVTTKHADPDTLGFARVVKDNSGKILRLVEQKDAKNYEHSLTDLNAGLYCFKYDFLTSYIDKITKSPVTGEYYLTELVDIAVADGYTIGEVSVPFEEVGIGVNTRQQLSDSQVFFREIND